MAGDHRTGLGPGANPERNVDAAVDRAGAAWQVGVWDGMSQIYADAIDDRFTPVVDGVITRATLHSGERVLDLGTGTGQAAIKAASLVGASGRVVGVDISPKMLTKARQRVVELGLGHVDFLVGRAEAISSADGVFDAMLASLSLMYAIDRQAAARECARVLRPGGRLVASVWGGPEECDIVLFQQTAGTFAPGPPVPGVGPGALANPEEFLTQLARAGIHARVETEILGFDFPDFATAWEVLASVTTAGLSPERKSEARKAVFHLMWPQGDGQRHFRNLTQFVVGHRADGQSPGFSRTRGSDRFFSY
jgi:SAM-dependent methyltransferase